VGNPAFTEACNKVFGNPLLPLCAQQRRCPARSIPAHGLSNTPASSNTSQLDDSLTWEQIAKDRLSGRIDNFLKPGADGISDHSMINYFEALSK